MAKLLQGHLAELDAIEADPAGAQDRLNAALAELAGKPLADGVIDRAFAAITPTHDPLADHLAELAADGVTAGTLTAVPDLAQIYDLRILNRLLVADGQTARQRRRLRTGVTDMPIVTEPDAGTTAAAPPAPAAPAHSVVVDGVSKIYRTGGKPVQALDNVTLKVQPGEFVSLVGASGCGKSTLLNLVAGLDRPTAGTVTSVSRPALMFQEPALLPWLSAGKNVELALKYAGVPRRSCTAGPRSCSRWSGSAARTSAGCTSCPAASGSGSRWPGRSPRTRRSC